MLHIALYEPEIPPNTGNIIRLCANTGCQLHLIKPLGFSFDDKQLRRAGLDYREFAQVTIHDSFQALRHSLPSNNVWAVETSGEQSYAEVSYQGGDVLLFGPETRGLPDKLIADLGMECCLRIPMRAESRSLNLSNSVALVVYEGMRQLGFPDMG